MTAMLISDMLTMLTDDSFMEVLMMGNNSLGTKMEQEIILHVQLMRIGTLIHGIELKPHY